MEDSYIKQHLEHPALDVVKTPERREWHFIINHLKGYYIREIEGGYELDVMGAFTLFFTTFTQDYGKLYFYDGLGNLLATMDL